jgi:hypothetical protein
MALRYVDGNVEGPGLITLRFLLVIGACACILFSLRATISCSVLPQALLVWFVLATVVAMGSVGLGSTAPLDAPAPQGLGFFSEAILIAVAVVFAAVGAARQRNVWFARRVMQLSPETVFDSMVSSTQAAGGAGELPVASIVDPASEQEDPALVQMYGAAPATPTPRPEGCFARFSVAVTKFQIRHPSTGFGSMLLLAAAAVLVAGHIVVRAYSERIGVIDAFQAAYRPGAVSVIIGLAIVCGHIVEQVFPIAVVALGTAATMPALLLAAGVALIQRGRGCGAVWDFVIPAVSQFCISHDRSAFNNFYYPGSYLGDLSGSSNSASGSASAGSSSTHALPPAGSSSSHGSSSHGSSSSGTAAARYYCDSRPASAFVVFLFVIAVVALVAATVFYRSYIQGHRAAVRLVGLFDAEAIYEARHAPAAVGGIGWWNATAADHQNEDRASLLAVTTQREQEVGTTMPKWARVAI